ncbi:hypothetical protein GQ53DRAFT_457311 [Thozetella sp. PMI_491]|nr:hypothetical protein GQ53DRAFT_457311 [Thozetella sp. PMI_491]
MWTQDTERNPPLTQSQISDFVMQEARPSTTSPQEQRGDLGEVLQASSTPDSIPSSVHCNDGPSARSVISHVGAGPSRYPPLVVDSGSSPFASSTSLESFSPQPSLGSSVSSVTTDVLRRFRSNGFAS